MHNKCCYKIGIADQLKELGVAGKTILKYTLKNQEQWVWLVAGCCNHNKQWFYINKIQQDAIACRYLFTAKSLYMFRVSIAPIIKST